MDSGVRLGVVGQPHLSAVGGDAQLSGQVRFELPFTLASSQEGHPIALELDDLEVSFSTAPVAAYVTFTDRLVWVADIAGTEVTLGGG